MGEGQKQRRCGDRRRNDDDDDDEEGTDGEAPSTRRQGRLISLPQRSVFPGQPLANILCEMLMGERMRAVRAQLGAEGPALHLATDERNGVQRTVTDADAAAAAP
eukprot:4470411-Pyramimonas_sp.AAC.1